MVDGDAVNWDRLAAMGIDRDMGNRIFKMIREDPQGGTSGNWSLPLFFAGSLQLQASSGLVDALLQLKGRLKHVHSSLDFSNLGV